ncbi:MAG: alpha/beta hydrolase [Bryobacteraceae bacterium]
MRFCALLPVALAAASAQDFTHEKDLPYATMDGVPLSMDILHPTAPGPHPAVVLVHGGGFSGGNRQGFLGTAAKLARAGFAAASISYRLTPVHQFPAPVHDAKAAVRFLRANAGKLSIDPEKIGAIGVSAGGTIALFLGVTSNLPEFEGDGPSGEYSSAVGCVVNLYGRSDMTTAYGGSRNAAGALPPLIGGELPWARQGHVRASAIQWVTPSTPPTLSIHGTLDLNVPYQQSVDLHARLREAGVENQLETIERGGHGFKGDDQEQADRAMIAFFRKHLRPEPDRLSLYIRAGREQITLGWPSGRILDRRPAAGAAAKSAILFDAKGPLRFGSISALLDIPGGHRLLADRTGRRIVEVDGQNVPVRELRELPFAPESLARAMDPPETASRKR